MIVIPLVTILWAALLPYYQVFSLAGLKLLTLQNFVDVLNAGSFAGSISNTLILGAAAATGRHFILFVSRLVHCPPA